MTLVAELVGIVESPRYLQAACSRRLPDTTASLLAEYRAWRTRHAQVLDAVARQAERASARARREGSRVSMADLSAAGAQVMRDRMDGLGEAQAREICRQYSELLRDKDVAMAESVPRRLAVIEAADRERSASEP